MSQTVLPTLGCWNTIGISGDRSCPELQTYIHCRNCPVYESAAEAFFERSAPENYLAEWTKLLSAPVKAADAEDLSVLIFRLGEEWLTIPTVVVVEVTSTRPIHTVPHRSNAIFVGLVSLRGQLHLLVSLSALLNLTKSQAVPVRQGAERLIVIRKDSRTWVFETDEVLEVQRFAQSALSNVPSTLVNPESSFSKAVLDYKGKSLGFLDDQRIFDALREVCK